jgi:hypothetical protein
VTLPATARRIITLAPTKVRTRFRRRLAVFELAVFEVTAVVGAVDF